MRAPVLVLALGLLAVACRPAPPPAQRDAGPPARCEDLKRRFVGLREGAPRVCATAADCTFYVAGVVDCGGVVDQATATRLASYGESIKALKCPGLLQCAPRAAVAVCREGRCREESPAPAPPPR
ncbi:MAG TPA: hypothetical protein VGQ83_38490 [Polyangia bacterium]|jgi:hypothetical protein